MARRTALVDEASARLLTRFAGQAFSLQEAESVGVSIDRMRHLVALGDCRRVARGQYVCTAATIEQTLPDRIRSRLARHGDDYVVAHATAAQLHELRTPYLAQLSDERIWLLRDPDVAWPHHRLDVATLPAQFDPGHVQILGDLRVTTLARTAMDLARGCTLERALVPIDHALARGVPRGALVELAVFMKGWPWSRVFEPALDMASALAESGLESMARGAIRLAGVEDPELQLEIRGLSGKRYRVDMAWTAPRVILEIDGQEKYEDSEAPTVTAPLFKEKQREDDLRRADWDVVRWTYEDVFAGERPGLSWLKRALIRGRAR